MKKNFTRLTALLVVVVMIFLLLIGRLVYIQLINGDYYREIAEAMGEKPKVEIASRGEILDRNEKKLATNRLGYSIIYTAPKTKLTEEDINKSIIEAINILYKNGDESKIFTTLFPIYYNPDTDKYSFKTSEDGKYGLLKYSRALKKNNKIENDKDFDYTVLDDFEDKIAQLKKDESKSVPDEIAKFEGKYLKDYDPEKDAQDVFLRFAEKYNLVTVNDKAKLDYTNKYQLGKDRLYYATALRFVVRTAIYRQYEDVDIAKNVKKETAWEFQIKNDGITGISTQITPIRYYPYGEVGSAFLGYLGKISNTEKYQRLGYDLSRELVGKNGLEAFLENRETNGMDIQLRGEPGIKYMKVDKFGKIIEESASIESVPGDTVVTAINIDMQEAAEKSLEKVMEKMRTGKLKQNFPAYRGAVVAMDVNTGEVLALASRPGFNPNDFAETGIPSDPLLLEKYLLTAESRKKVDDDKFNIVPLPMFNYATQGAVAPGSIFKPFTGIVGLEENKITKNTIINDRGIYPLGTDGIKCWIYNEQGRTHGNVNVVSALEQSCNYFFNTVGAMIGSEKFSEWARKFGLAKDEFGKRPRTGIEITESPGIVGTPDDSRRVQASTQMRRLVTLLEELKYGKYTIESGTSVYYDIYNMLLDGVYDEGKLNEIGITNKAAQQQINSAIIKINKEIRPETEVVYMAMGQGMVSLTPVQMAQYISTIINGGTEYKAHLIKKVLNPDGSVKKEIQPEILNKVDLNPNNVKTIMEGMGAAAESGSAASTFRGYPILTGGKTGTAQSEVRNNPAREAYAWYVGFAPYDKPEIAIAAVIYDGGHGYYTAEVVRDVMDAYFKDHPDYKDRPEVQAYFAKKSAEQQK